MASEESTNITESAGSTAAATAAAVGVDSHRLSAEQSPDCDSTDNDDTTSGCVCVCVCSV